MQSVRLGRIENNMIIGVDGGALGVDDERLKVGVYKVTLRVLEQLSLLDADNNYRLYSFNRLGEGTQKQLGAQFEYKVITPKIGWQKIWLPLELKFRPVDVFLGMSQAIPSNTSYNIGFVYDLAFLKYPQAYPDSQQRLVHQTDTLVRRSQSIIVNSQSVKGELINRYDYPADAIYVCHLGVDTQFSQLGVIYKGRNPYFLYVGALKPLKNVPMLIRAFAQFLHKTKKPFDLLLVGGNYWMDPEIEMAIKETNIESHITMLGYVPDTKLADYYRGAAAFVAPSLFEGFCLPAIEAMASECPVIVSDRGSLPEIVGSAGIFVDPENASTISDAMEKIVRKQEIAQKMKLEGVKQAKKYRWDTCAKEILEVINNSLH
jgi:glycosyltransferase involved in cell wall biosynthesis